jgi:glycosyltransferase involved in cell wall biosynthesis
MAAGPQISAVVVVHNEERVIERCLDSLEGAVDEILVVHDGPCEDNTLQIAKNRGCRVFVRPRIGHAEHHRPFAYEQARGEWILNVDGDEFLSEELRAALSGLAARTDVGAFEFEWPMWDGERYMTSGGPYKLALMRRDALHAVGLIHKYPEIDGAVERLDLRLEHRPLYNNFSLAVMRTKWRRWARLHAGEYLSDLRTFPRFNEPARQWSRTRRVANRLAPVLWLPYAVATFVVAFRQLAYLPLGQRLRFAAYQGIYIAMVQLELARAVFVGRRAPRALPITTP